MNEMFKVTRPKAGDLLFPQGRFSLTISHKNEGELHTLFISIHHANEDV